MPDNIDAVAIERWCAAGLDGLRRHQREIDDLNVYPVPDGDTGTNLVLTMMAAVEALNGGDTATGSGSGRTALGLALHRLARGALLGARGNSGVILSQLLRGLADTLARVVTADGLALAAALDRAAVTARAAVAEPVEGTMLTVASAAARESHQGSDIDAVVLAAARAAHEALARTPEQLPVLARAGVVDAGGRGLVVLLDALAEVVTGQAPADTGDLPVARRMPLTVARETGSAEYCYEVQYLLDADAAAVDRLRAALAGLGDSLVVVGSGGAADAPSTWNVHVHVNDVGAAIEEGVRAGRPYRISVTRFADQMAGDQTGTGAGRGLPASPGFPAPQGADRPDDGDRAVVVVCRGDGLRGLFAAEGAVTLNGSPSTAEVLAAIQATGAGRVVVLPNDPNTTAVASAAAAAAREAGVHAGVVPTSSPVQALAALAVRDPGRRFEDDVIAMAEAAGACRHAEVTVASREALTVAGRCAPGDVLALVEGEVNLIGADLVDTCRHLLDRLLAGGGELVTLVLGEAAPADLGPSLEAHLTERWPFVEVQRYDGGQPRYPLLVGVE